MRPVKGRQMKGGGFGGLLRAVLPGRGRGAPVVERVGPGGRRSAPLPKKALRAERGGFGRRWRTGGHFNGLGIAATVALYAGTGLYGLVLGGYVASLREVPAAVLSRATHALGFGLAEVRVSGIVKMTPEEVIDRMGLDHRTSLLGLDVDAARRRLLEVPWIKSASVRVYLPSTIDVAVVEREPFALWQRGGQINLVDREGLVIGPYDDPRFSHLPLVVGEGAERRVGEFAGLLEPHPAIRSRVRAGVLVADRRWTLKLADGVDVMLPERDPAHAVALLARLDRENGLLNRDIAAVDMRLAERVVVRLTDRAATIRTDSLRARSRMPATSGPASPAPVQPVSQPNRPGRVT